MHSMHVRQLREAVAAAQRFAQKSTLDGCDLSDIDEITSPLTHELERANPNTQTLATYLNSLLRSLRVQPHAAEICAQLDEVMKQSGIATDWQH
jgi:ABC-type transporter Mla subunit MlaD